MRWVFPGSEKSLQSFPLNEVLSIHPCSLSGWGIEKEWAGNFLAPECAWWEWDADAWGPVGTSGSPISGELGVRFPEDSTWDKPYVSHFTIFRELCSCTKPWAPAFQVRKSASLCSFHDTILPLGLSRVSNLEKSISQATSAFQELWSGLSNLFIDRLVAQTVKNPPAMWETWVRPLGREDPLEEGTATQPSVLAWRIPADRGAWQAAVHGVTKSQARLSRQPRKASERTHAPSQGV